MDFGKWHPQEELQRDICTEQDCDIKRLAPAISFLLHAIVLPPSLIETPTPDSMQVFDAIRYKRIRNFVIQVGAAAQIMELDENELATGCLWLMIQAGISFEKRFFEGAFEGQKWSKP